MTFFFCDNGIIPGIVYPRSDANDVCLEGIAVRTPGVASERSGSAGSGICAGNTDAAEYTTVTGYERGKPVAETEDCSGGFTLYDQCSQPVFSLDGGLCSTGVSHHPGWASDWPLRGCRCAAGSGNGDPECFLSLHPGGKGFSGHRCRNSQT